MGGPERTGEQIGNFSPAVDEAVDLKIQVNRVTGVIKFASQYVLLEISQPETGRIAIKLFVILVDGLDARDPRQYDFGAPAKAGLDMGGYATNGNLEITRHEFTIKPEVYPVGRTAYIRQVMGLKCIVIEHPVVLHDVIPKLFTGINQIVRPVSAKGPDEPDLLFGNSRFMKGVEHNASRVLDRCWTGHIVEYDNGLPFTASQFTQGRSINGIFNFYPDLRRCKARFFQTWSR